MAYRMAKIFSCTVGALFLAFKEVDGGEIKRFLQANGSKGDVQCLDPDDSSVSVSYPASLASSTAPNASAVARASDSLLVTSTSFSHANSTNQALTPGEDCSKDLGDGQTPYILCRDCGQSCDNALDQSRSFCVHQTISRVVCRVKCCTECEGVLGCCPGMSQGVECFPDKQFCTVGNLPSYKPAYTSTNGRFFCSVTGDQIKEDIYHLLLTDNGMTATGSFTHMQTDGSAWTSSSQGGWNDPNADVQGIFYTDGTNIVTQVGPFSCEGNPVNINAGPGEGSNLLEWESSDGTNYETARVKCKITCFGLAPTIGLRCRLFFCAPL